MQFQQFHPLTLILLWLSAAITLQAVQGWSLAILSGSVILLLLPLTAGKRWLRMLWRLRWLWLSLGVVFAWATPGEVLWEASWAPTREGMVEAGLHFVRLWSLLATVTLIAAAMPVPRLLCGLFLLLQPLRRIGLPPERAVARLLLTLTMVENLPDGHHWRGFLHLLQSVPAAPVADPEERRPPASIPTRREITTDTLPAAAASEDDDPTEGAVEDGTLTLEHPYWHWRDSAALLLGLTLLAGLWLAPLVRLPAGGEPAALPVPAPTVPPGTPRP